MISNAKTTRRKLLQAGAVASALGLSQSSSQAQSRQSPRLNTNSAPSALKITDIRGCTVASNFDYPLIRIDTNQGVYGLGEVRDGGVKGQALVLKPLIMGRNPLQIHTILDRLKPYAGHGRLGGGYSAIDMALHDIAGKVYGVPAYRLIGDKRRDRIRVYCDTIPSKDPKVYAQRMLDRKKRGFTFFKADIGVGLIRDRPGALRDRVPTEKGLAYMGEYLQAIRDAIGYEAPLGTDHYGPLGVQDAIRLGHAFERFELAWLEDPIPWTEWRGLKQIAAAVSTPVLTGEDIFGVDGFRDLIENEAIDLIQPDPETSGAIRETALLAGYADEHGIPTVFHFAGSPVGCMASVHCAATIRNFIVMENHAVDIPWWDDMVHGTPKPIVNQGYIQVPEAPGLGVTLNDDVVKEHLRYPGYFEPTPQFDFPVVSFGIWERGPYPHITEDGTLRNAPDH
ncbi:MAG: mandelate racemase/muconate lactonizing enzyme family protein [Bryobacterales bacterium]|nr:mandelate racemase/muconate lactonizing enzyme family protein [Bryobacterales bacterium]